MQFLRQSTNSQVVELGPFVSDTDFKTTLTGLTIANTDIKIIQGGSSANKNSGGGTHIVGGTYSGTFNSTDSATVGRARIQVEVSGALPVWKDIHILEEAVYDALFGASALGYVANAPVNVAQFGGVNITSSGGRPEVNVTHRNGVLAKRVYLYWATSDAASGTALKASIEAAAKGTTVYVGPGVFDIGDNSMTVPAGIRVIGSGIDITTFYTNGEGQCPLQLGAGSIAEDLTSLSMNDLTAPAFNALGTISNPCVLRRVRLFGQVDGLYQDAPTARSARIFDSIIRCPLDPVTLLNVGHYFELDNCLIISGPAVDSNARGLNLNSTAHVQARKCTFVAYATGSVDTDYAISAKGSSTVELEDCTILTIGSISKVKAIEVISGATVRCTNCEFDRSLVDGTLALDALSPLQPTTPNRKLDVSAGGEAGVDWSNIGSPTTAVSLSGTAVGLLSSERTTLSALIEAAFINEADSTAFLAALLTKINTLTSSDLATVAIATATRDAILNRILSGNHNAAGTTGAVLQLIASMPASVAAQTNIATALATIALNLDAKVSEAGGGGDGSGTGADQVTITVSQSGNPVADAGVWITTDSDGRNVVAGTLQTDSEGKVLFLLDAGDTYYLWMQKDGSNPILGQQFIATADP